MKYILHCMEDFRRRALYITALNVCEPWEQKLARILFVLFDM